MNQLKVKCGTQNLRGLGTNYYNIVSLLSSNRYVVLLLQETLCNKSNYKNVYSRNYQSVHTFNANGKRTRGLCTMIRKDFKIIKIINNENNILVILVQNI